MSFVRVVLKAVASASIAVILGELFNCWGCQFTLYLYRQLWTCLLIIELGILIQTVNFNVKTLIYSNFKVHLFYLHKNLCALNFVSKGYT